MALNHADARSLMALELVNKALRDRLRSPALDGVWAAHVPRQVDQRLGQAVSCIGKPNVNESVPSTLAARGRYLRSRHATILLREHAKTRHTIPIDTWWADAKDAILRGADIDLRDDRIDQTLLHWAVLLSDFKMVRELCKAGLSTFSRNRAGDTPVDLAISGSRIAERVQDEQQQADMELVLAALGGSRSAG